MDSSTELRANIEHALSVTFDGPATARELSVVIGLKESETKLLLKEMESLGTVAKDGKRDCLLSKKKRETWRMKRPAPPPEPAVTRPRASRLAQGILEFDEC